MPSENSTVDDWDMSQLEISLDGVDNPFKESFRNVEKRYQQTSQFNQYKTYKLKTIIVKSNDDLRQEVLAMQLMKRMKEIF